MSLSSGVADGFADNDNGDSDGCDDVGGDMVIPMLIGWDCT